MNTDFYKKITSFFLSIMIIFPLALLAQEAVEVIEEDVPATDPSQETESQQEAKQPETSTVEEPIADEVETEAGQEAVEVIEENVPATDPSQETESPQETAPIQDSTSGSLIADPVDPQESADLDVDVDVDVEADQAEAPDTPLVSPEDFDTVPVAVELPEELSEQYLNETITEVTNIDEPVMVVTEEELAPSEKYLFSIEGQSIPTNEKPLWAQSDVEKKGKVLIRKVNGVPALSSDDEEGMLNINGSCTEPYFVVLLYATAEDYNSNPSYSIYNKAFECSNGSYNYSLSDLPSNLKDGRYFLLIGAQGNSGPWKPASALIPVNIIKENDEI